MAGQISFLPLQPANAQITQNGTSSEKIGNCRPTIAPRIYGSRPVTEARPWIGVPSAPKATGAVLAISDRPDAASGEKPRPISTAPVTATGVPKPDAPSKNAPNENAISSNCSRRSAVTPPTARLSASKRPADPVSWYMKMTLSTIQPIGKKPDTTPSSDARIDMPAGMVKMKIATRLATTSAVMAAICTLTLPLAINTSRVTTGTAAAMVDSAVLLNGL